MYALTIYDLFHNIIMKGVIYMNEYYMNRRPMGPPGRPPGGPRPNQNGFLGPLWGSR